MTLPSNSRHAARSAAALAIVALLAAPGGCKHPPKQAAADAAADAVARAARKPVVIYDEEGIRLPQEALPLGTPVPLGLKEATSGRGWSRWSGWVRKDEVIAFYGKYLTLPEGTAPHEVGMSVRFLDARPRQPGNPGRKIEVRVLDEKMGATCAVMIIDVATQEKDKGKDWSKVPLVDPREWKPDKPGDQPPSDLL